MRNRPGTASSEVAVVTPGVVYTEEDDEDADAEGEADPDGAFEADLMGSGSVFTTR